MLPLTALMPVQPPRPLNKQIDRSQVANHHIEVQIQALLDDLCSNHNCLMWSLTLLAKIVQHRSFYFLPPQRGEPGVEQDEMLPCNIKGTVIGGLHQSPVNGLSAADSVANHSRAASVCQSLVEVCAYFFRLPLHIPIQLQ